MTQSYPPIPDFTKSEIKRAGKTLADDLAAEDKKTWARDVLNKWRGCHGYPINTFQATLRRKLAKGFGSEPIVSQRLKRAATIIHKLKDFPMMDLYRMQDIGGVRAVLSTLSEMRKLESEYRDGSRFSHELMQDLCRDYITVPKPDGYRSVHLIYKYINPSLAHSQHNGLLIELQLRTKLQHSWAIAAEITTMVLGEAIKSRKNREDDKWKRFFALTSSAFAYLEGSPLIPGYESMSRNDTFDAVKKIAEELEIERRLGGVFAATQYITSGNKKSSFHLIVLDAEKKQVSVRSFARNALQEAIEEYGKAEALGEKIEPVLVSATNLERAYPSFFLNADAFLHNLKRITSRT